MEDKVVVIYFLPLYLDCPHQSEHYMSVLKEVYYDLPNNSFEVVLVANRQRHYGLKHEYLVRQETLKSFLKIYFLACHGLLYHIQMQKPGKLCKETLVVVGIKNTLH